MKKGLLFTGLLISSMASAQSLTQANEPAIGATSNMFLCDSFATNYDAVTGTGVTWDYSPLLGYTGETRNVTVVDAATTPDAASFPGATKAFQVENSVMTYFSSTATDRISQGFKFTEATIGEVLATFTADPLTMVTYPFANGNSLTDSYNGNINYDFGGGPQSSPVTGNASAWIDGEGTLLLPNNVSLTNVIRYKSIDTSLTSIPPLLNDLEIIRIQYEYYDHSVQNLPVFIHSTVILQTPTSLIDMATLVLSKYETTAFVGTSEKAAIDFNVYPNPARNSVKITGELGADAVGSILDQSGRKLSTMSISNGQTIDISNLSEGIYFLKIESNGHSTTKRIVKK
ncbi:MAG: T9SS type A sorting domain-containing protein [Crocinitomicaceae bacterium]|nr:T9SS type A sorting domain-containing protein [Crocinitomicaceae bacterium]